MSITLKPITKGMETGPEDIQANFQKIMEAINGFDQNLTSLSAAALQFKTKTGGFNDVTSTGMYIVTDGAPGGTSDSTHGLLVVVTRSSVSCTQTWIDNNVWLRNDNAGTWTAWTKVG